MEIREILRQAREDLGLSQSDIARRLIIDQSQVSRYESGYRDWPLDRAQQYAKNVGYTLHVSIRKTNQ